MSKFLDDCAAFAKEQMHGIYCISEVHSDGSAETVRLVGTNLCQNAYSVAKSFTMVGIGLLYDMGLVRPEDKICDILADDLPESGMDARWKDVTVHMALTHSLGLPGGFLDIDCNRSTLFTDDYLRYTLTYPLEYDPGTSSAYSDGAFYLLSCVVEKISGMTLDNFLWQKVGLPLEFQELAWSHCPKGHAMGGTGLYISCEDMAKTASLFLTGGTYCGKRILSEEWVNMAIDRGYTLAWNGEHTMYGKGGMYGQEIFVIPAQDRAIGIQSYTNNTAPLVAFMLDYKD